MKSYQDFKKINEADGTPPNPLQDIEKQIDALFDELKQKLRSPATPRSAISSDWRSWIDKNRHKYEWHKLEEYHAIKNYTQSFHEALTSEENLDAVLDEYKEKLKQMVRAFASSMPAPKRVGRPRKITGDADMATATVNPASTVAKEEPAAPATTTTTPPAATTTTAAPSTVTAAKEEPPVPAPAATTTTPAAATTTVAPTTTTAAPTTTTAPAPAAAKEEPGIGPQEEELMKLGAAVLFARDITGEKDVSPEDVEYGMQHSFNVKSHMGAKDMLIKAAREYQQQQTNTSLHAGTSTKDAIEEPPSAAPTPEKEPMPAAAAETAHPSKEDLIAMTPKQFKAWMMEHDPELISAYEDFKWWTHSFRDEIVDSYLSNQFMRQKQAESLQYRVNKYKEMLRKDDRPEILLHEAIKIPFSKRVGFYKKKLSCRDTF